MCKVPEARNCCLGEGGTKKIQMCKHQRCVIIVGGEGEGGDSKKIFFFLSYCASTRIALPLAVDIAPTVRKALLNLESRRPSGQTFCSMKRRKYSCGWMR